MTRSLLLAGLSSAFLLTSPATSSAVSPLDAREMLEVAILAIKGDKDLALAMFNNPKSIVFRHDDRYIFCADAQGKVVAHGLPTLIGQDFTTVIDKTGKEFGRHMLTTAVEGEFAFTGYYLPKPNGTQEFYREDYFTKVRDLTCGSGYYTTKTE